MKIAITGHRPNKLGNDYEFKSNLSKSIINELQEVIDKYQPTEIITGMALGIDTMWAVLAIKNKIPFRACIPCNNHSSKWVASSVKLYNRIINDPLCTVINVTNENYTPKCMQVRNVYMVDECDMLVAVWDGTAGGTGNCYKYADNQGKDIVRINPNDFRK